MGFNGVNGKQLKLKGLGLFVAGSFALLKQGVNEMSPGFSLLPSMLRPRFSGKINPTPQGI